MRCITIFMSRKMEKRNILLTHHCLERNTKIMWENRRNTRTAASSGVTTTVGISRCIFGLKTLSVSIPAAETAAEAQRHKRVKRYLFITTMIFFGPCFGERPSGSSAPGGIRHGPAAPETAAGNPAARSASATKSGAHRSTPRPRYFFSGRAMVSRIDVSAMIFFIL